MALIEYPIRKSRVTLRPMRPGDIDAIFAYHSLEEVARYQFWDAREWDEMVIKMDSWSQQTQINDDNLSLVLAVEDNASGKLAGDVVLFLRDEAALQAEIGYTFNPAFWGQGLATQAAEALLELAFDLYGLHRVYGRCDARNMGSRRLMERLGMRCEAHFREHQLFKGEWDEEMYFAMLEDEWRARKQKDD